VEPAGNRCPASRAASRADDRIVEAFRTTGERIPPIGRRHRCGVPVRADHVLEIDGIAVPIVEAKRARRSVVDGIGQIGGR